MELVVEGGMGARMKCNEENLELTLKFGCVEEKLSLQEVYLVGTGKVLQLLSPFICDIICDII